MFPPQEPDLSLQAMTLQLTLESSWLIPELDEPPFLAALIASPRSPELSRLSINLQQNAHALRRTFLAWTARPPAHQANPNRRLLPLAQYEPALAALRRHQEQRRQHTRELLAILQSALPPALQAELPADWPSRLHEQTAALLTPAPAPTWAEFLAAELPRRPWQQKLPFLARRRQRQAQARYRQALQEVQDRAQRPLPPIQAWQPAAGRQILQFRAYYLLPFLPGNNPVKALARKVRAQANPYALTLLNENGDTLALQQSRWIPKP